MASKSKIDKRKRARVRKSVDKWIRSLDIDKKSELKKILSVKMAALAQVEKELKERQAIAEPLEYGLPDLLFGQGAKPAEKVNGKWVRGQFAGAETDKEYKERQNAALKEMVESYLWIVKDGIRIAIKLIPEMVRFMSDAFYGREKKLVIWKPRGGGGSLCAGIVIWLFMVYRQRSFIDIAGAQVQAQIVYDYVTGFWSCVPSLLEKLVDGDPLVSKTRLKTGVTMRCIPSSEKQARGKHGFGLVNDEACQAGSKDGAMRAALQTVMSEPEFCVIILSTFHLPTGFFQEHWDHAEERGFKKYRWGIYDTMMKCEEKIDCKECYLTEQVEEEVDVGGRMVMQKRWKGCNGKARTGYGFMSRAQVIEAKKTNKGTLVYQVEFENERPSTRQPLFSTDLVDASKVDKFSFNVADKKVVGIDWGWDPAQTVAVLGVLTQEECSADTVGAIAIERGEEVGFVRQSVVVGESVFLSQKGVDQLVSILLGWVDAYGEFRVLPDSSHPFNNNELAEAGFRVLPVKFGTWRQFGIRNMQRYFSYKRVKILREFTTLTSQLKECRDLPVGSKKPEGWDGPDALLCMLLGFPFMKMFPGDLIEAERGMVKKLDSEGENEGTVMIF